MKQVECQSCGFLFDEKNLRQVEVSVGTFEDPAAMRMLVCHDCDPEGNDE